MFFGYRKKGMGKNAIPGEEPSKKRIRGWLSPFLDGVL
jgi:hypothetical protein